MPQERIRKFTEENLELARNLKKEIDRVAQMTRARTTGPAMAVPKGKKNTGSARPSEERSTPQQVAGKKRVRDADTERVSLFYLVLSVNLCAVTAPIIVDPTLLRCLRPFIHHLSLSE